MKHSPKPLTRQSLTPSARESLNPNPETLNSKLQTEVSSHQQEREDRITVKISQ